MPTDPENQPARLSGPCAVCGSGWHETDSHKQRHRYVVTLEAQDGDGIRGLRLLLKRALRSYGLRCIHIEEIIPTGVAPLSVP